jgi:hypothetical protein
VQIISEVLFEFLSQNFVPIELGPFEFLEASNRFLDLFGEITSCWLLFSFSKRLKMALQIFQALLLHFKISNEK